MTTDESKTRVSPTALIEYFIYAVAKNPDGRYWFHPESDIYCRQFVSSDVRQAYWENLIAQPEIAERGATFELGLVNATPNKERWSVVEAVYSDYLLLRGSRSRKRGVLIDCTPKDDLDAIAAAVRQSQQE